MTSSELMKLAYVNRETKIYYMEKLGAKLFYDTMSGLYD